MIHTQAQAWNKEYQDNQLMSSSDEPQADILKFLKWLKKDCDFVIDESSQVLDLGCGTGRSARYIAHHYGAHVTGYDFAENAITQAKDRLKEKNIEDQVNFFVQSIGTKYPLPDQSIDIVLDMMASHALNPEERNIYLQETARVIKPNGYFFVRLLTRDGDRNAQNLLAQFPGADYDTYVHPDLGITERVFREEDFRELYGLYFQIHALYKQKGYQHFRGKAYKRRYLVAYMSLHDTSGTLL